MQTPKGCTCGCAPAARPYPCVFGRRAPPPDRPGWRADPYSSTPFTFPSARRFSMIFWAIGGGTVS